VSSRALIWLSAALAALIVLAIVGQRQTGPETFEAEAIFLPGLMEELDSVEGIEIAQGGNERVATLQRDESGWRVAEKNGYRADLTKVRHSLLGLAEARILERKTSNPELHSRLGVEDIEDGGATGLAVTLTGPATPITVVVGDTAGEYRRYVRRAGEDQSYLIDRDPELGETATDWLDSEILNIEAARIREVTLTHPDGEVLRVSKASPEQTNFTVDAIPEGRALLYESVANVMGSVLQNLTLEDVQASAEIEDGYSVTEFRTFDGLVLTARGIERDDGETWVSFAAEFDPELAAESAEAEDRDTEDGETGEADIDPAAQAQQLNDRLAGWSYRIPGYKFEQLTRRMSDLLQAQ
jgi:hypothetical protein